MIYLKLFLSFLQIGCFSFGGGYAAMPLIQEQVVTLNHWLTMNAFTDLVTIAEMTPGPIAVNAATFVGTQIAGTPGAVAATLGCILPSCIFVTLLAFIYTKYRNLSLLQGTLASLRPAVVAMIAKAGLTIIISAFFVNGLISFTRENVSVRMVLYFILAVVLLRKVKLNPILVMVLCGLLEVSYYTVTHVIHI
ncbi:chromate transporter [Faecalicatena orotica]|uniref:Chromate transporter n=1 Tax=Faecalicatena orotica TaxID=1544 RepID=A0A2Y9BGI1_9FIRM|nr:chromate transporter [Faecalicatena orotica]PWJ29491.1 chromate transporter [Faecalicatena orotica]SSA55946.1 chromate transporter [Faecalicatena orotica]